MLIHIHLKYPSAAKEGKSPQNSVSIQLSSVVKVSEAINQTCLYNLDWININPTTNL